MTPSKTNFALFTVVAILAIPSTASATTFCVPAFDQACPNDGSHVAKANLQDALTQNGSDGSADRVIVAPAILTAPKTFKATGTDPIEIVGVGPDATVLTNDTDENYFVLDLGTRKPTLRNFRIVIPSKVGDGSGGGLRVGDGAVVENVHVESRNEDSQGIEFHGGGNFRDGAIYGTSSGTIDTAFSGDSANARTVSIDRYSIEDTIRPVVLGDPDILTFLERTRIVNPLDTGVTVVNGAHAIVQNTIVETNAGGAFEARSFGARPDLLVRHTTVVRTGGPDLAAFTTQVNDGAAHGADVRVYSSIVRGFQTVYRRHAPTGASGDGNLSISNSNFANSGVSEGDGTLAVGDSNIDADPLFKGPGDLHLLAGSPSIDTAVHQAGFPVAVDFDGAPRPVDGNGDGSAIEDQGAFEYQPPQQPGGGDPGGGDPGGGGGSSDKASPVIGKLKVAKGFRATKGGLVTLMLSEPATVVLTFKPSGKPKGGKKVVVTFQGSLGKNAFKIAKRKLKARGYKLAVVAADPAGNRSKPATAKLTPKL